MGVKLLDFGLAKMNGGAVQTDGDATLTMSLTGKGQIVGTLSYMSPEQIQGTETGPASDIFSFGLVLYEMLTGTRAFNETSPASLIAAILEREPPSLGDVAPDALDRVLKRCLAKNPDERWQSAHDLKLALELASTREIQAAPPARAVSLGARVAFLALIAAVAFLGLAAYRHSTEEPPHLVKLSALPPENTRFENYFAVSPDGKHLAFVATSKGPNSLWIRDLDSG
jgi:serine/threonine protein kinase